MIVAAWGIHKFKDIKYQNLDYKELSNIFYTINSLFVGDTAAIQAISSLMNYFCSKVKSRLSINLIKAMLSI